MMLVFCTSVLQLQLRRLFHLPWWGLVRNGIANMMTSIFTNNPLIRNFGCIRG